MSLRKSQPLALFRSADLIGIGMEADAARRKLHPEAWSPASLTATSTTQLLHQVLHRCAFQSRGCATVTPKQVALGFSKSKSKTEQGKLYEKEQLEFFSSMFSPSLCFECHTLQ